MIVGVVLAVAAAVCFAAGCVVQALEARASAAAPARPLALLARLRRRRTGPVAGVGVGLQALALLAAPLSLVQPALALAPALLIDLAVRVLGDRRGPNLPGRC